MRPAGPDAWPPAVVPKHGPFWAASGCLHGAGPSPPPLVSQGKVCARGTGPGRLSELRSPHLAGDGDGAWAGMRPRKGSSVPTRKAGIPALLRPTILLKPTQHSVRCDGKRMRGL